MLCKGTDSLLKVSCALAEMRYLLPVPADNWSKLSKNFGALFFGVESERRGTVLP